MQVWHCARNREKTVDSDSVRWGRLPWKRLYIVTCQIRVRTQQWTEWKKIDKMARAGIASFTYTFNSKCQFTPDILKEQSSLNKITKFISLDKEKVLFWISGKNSDCLKKKWRLNWQSWCEYKKPAAIEQDRCSTAWASSNYDKRLFQSVQPAETEWSQSTDFGLDRCWILV